MLTLSAQCGETKPSILYHGASGSKMTRPKVIHPNCRALSYVSVSRLREGQSVEYARQLGRQCASSRRGLRLAGVRQGRVAYSRASEPTLRLAIVEGQVDV